MRPTTVFILMVAMASSVAAQNHTEDVIAIASGGIFRVTQAGKFTSLTPFNSSGFAPGCMDVDNKTYLVASQRLYRFARSGTLLTTYGPQLQITAAMLDQGGDFVVFDAASRSLMRISRSGQVSFLARFAVGFSPFEALATDVESGDILATSGPSVHRIAPGGRVTTFVYFPVPSSEGIPAKHLSNGDMFVSRQFEGHQWTLRIDRQGVIKTVNRRFHASFDADRASAARPRFLSAFGSLGHVDLATGGVKRIPGTYRIYGSVFYDQGRNLATRSVKPGRWDVLLSLPQDGGRPYVLALSASGIRPGVPLPDGRKIAFNPDVLTSLSLRGVLTPWLSGHTGFLSAAGTAKACIDVSSMPQTSGLHIWIQAVVLDPAAPIGIATIPDPVILRL